VLGPVLVGGLAEGIGLRAVLGVVAVSGLSGLSGLAIFDLSTKRE